MNDWYSTKFPPHVKLNIYPLMLRATEICEPGGSTFAIAEPILRCRIVNINFQHPIAWFINGILIGNECFTIDGRAEAGLSALMYQKCFKQFTTKTLMPGMRIKIETKNVGKHPHLLTIMLACAAESTY
jgi:hypothetical protein